jgi:hypothetical protein
MIGVYFKKDKKSDANKNLNQKQLPFQGKMKHLHCMASLTGDNRIWFAFFKNKE